MTMPLVVITTLALAPGLQPLPRRAVASAMAGGLIGAAAYAVAAQRSASHTYDSKTEQRAIDGVTAVPPDLSTRYPDLVPTRSLKLRDIFDERSAPREPVLFWDQMPDSMVSRRRRSAV